MTSKERVMAAMEWRRPDRMPIFDSFWPEYREVWQRAKSTDEYPSLADFYGIDVQICVPDETPYPSRVRRLDASGGESRRRDGYGRLLRAVSGAYFTETLEVPIQTHRDLDTNPFDPVEDDARYVRFMDVVRAGRDKRCCFCKVGGPYLRTTFIRGETQFLIDIAQDREFARVLADRMGDFLLGIGLQALARSGLYETGIWIYDDMAYNDNPMFSPESFEQVFLPAYRRMVGGFKAAGAHKVILHCDGNVAPLLDMLIDAGIDGINPVEPKAGLDVAALKDQYGQSLCYFGGMCNAHVLPSDDADLIQRETRRILEAGREGGIVIGSHSIGPDVPVSAYECYHETVMSDGAYDGGR